MSDGQSLVSSMQSVDGERLGPIAIASRQAVPVIETSTLSAQTILSS